MTSQRIDKDRLDGLVASTQRERLTRERGYREQALKLLPWICGRCQREFNRSNIHELTVHHRDHDHDNNPPDGSNWELLCRYCHDNEHARGIDSDHGGGGQSSGGGQRATHKGLAGLGDLLNQSDD